eukprot:128751-Pleurochrysis_carterae.AAC.3
MIHIAQLKPMCHELHRIVADRLQFVLKCLKTGWPVLRAVTVIYIFEHANWLWSCDIKFAWSLVGVQQVPRRDRRRGTTKKGKGCFQCFVYARALVNYHRISALTLTSCLLRARSKYDNWRSSILLEMTVGKAK